MGDMILSWFVFFLLILVLPIAGTGLYLLYKGRLKLFLAYIAFVTVVVGYIALKYYMNSDPQVLPGVIRSYGEWFFKAN
jgi:hypothetical protein